MRSDELPAETLHGPRLDLEPLRVDHADEMAPLLDDPQLHTFVRGEPATADELRDRYGRLAAGRSPDGRQKWLNWIVRRRADGRAVGTVQATVGGDGENPSAEVAWVVARRYQGKGYAREAAECMVGWLRAHGVILVRAHVHPGHTASQGVARAIGLTPTATIVDGEVRWQSATSSRAPRSGGSRP